jgi:hypothetical protein
LQVFFPIYSNNCYLKESSLLNSEVFSLEMPVYKKDLISASQYKIMLRIVQLCTSKLSVYCSCLYSYGEKDMHLVCNQKREL